MLTWPEGPTWTNLYPNQADLVIWNEIDMNQPHLNPRWSKTQDLDPNDLKYKLPKSKTTQNLKQPEPEKLQNPKPNLNLRGPKPQRTPELKMTKCETTRP